MRHVLLHRADNVTVVQAVVADRLGIVAFRRAASNAMGLIAKSGEYLVPAVSLDYLTTEESMLVPDIIKMDVEGAESRVLEGARFLLNRRKTIWFVAMHGEEQEHRRQSILTRAGSRLYKLDGTELDPGSLPTDEIYAVPT